MDYDVVIIGSGPGGYVCAIRFAQLGFKTAIVEKYNTLGGTCLNVGCIPSKALLDSSEHFHNATHNFEKHGIALTNLKVNMKQMIERKNTVVSQTCDGVQYLMDKNKIDVHTGLGSFVDANTINVKPEKGKAKKLTTKYTVIATGSKPNYFPGMEPDKKRIITSTEILDLAQVAKNLIVIGGGVVGLELGSVHARLGANVQVVEFADRIIPTMDGTISKELTKVLKKEGFKFSLKTKVQKVENTGKGVKVTALDKNNKEVVFKGDYCLVAVGRKPYTEGLALDKAGVKMDAKGRVEVDDHLKTSVDNIYAIGDVVKGAMLAHKAEDEGMYVAELLAGQKPHINYNLIPGVIYTWPEVAAVGKTEEELKEAGVNYKVGSFPLKALGRSRASMDIMGLVKIIADAETDEVLGVHMVSARAADMIMEAVTAMEFRASAEDMARICHPHPTYTEATKEAALAATEDRALHI
ncbi:dihydrolipoyl dehydrogenase [Crocinitomix catalasitica]|nr:dihydrolipoyl dehydrogenase [Crocinitomix catalasitica]